MEASLRLSKCSGCASASSRCAMTLSGMYACSMGSSMDTPLPMPTSRSLAVSSRRRCRWARMAGERGVGAVFHPDPGFHSSPQTRARRRLPTTASSTTAATPNQRAGPCPNTTVALNHMKPRNPCTAHSIRPDRNS